MLLSNILDEYDRFLQEYNQPNLHRENLFFVDDANITESISTCTVFRNKLIPLSMADIYWAEQLQAHSSWIRLNLIRDNNGNDVITVMKDKLINTNMNPSISFSWENKRALVIK